MAELVTTRIPKPDASDQLPGDDQHRSVQWKLQSETQAASTLSRIRNTMEANNLCPTCERLIFSSNQGINVQSPDFLRPLFGKGYRAEAAPLDLRSAVLLSSSRDLLPRSRESHFSLRDSFCG
eukprot:scaffold219143_cov32-Tisochrysis_lutea.AAC.2